MKHLSFFLLNAVFLLATSRTYDFQSGDLYYNITSDTTVEVTNGNYSDLTAATIPETVTYNGITYSVTGIRNEAFYDCYILASVTLPTSITRIGDGAFSGCSSLASITIPNSVTSIGDKAFVICSSLISVTLLGDVSHIGDGAFIYCSTLEEIHLHSLIPPTITMHTFEQVNRSFIVYVPDEALEAYQSAAVWKELRILPESEAPASTR